MTLSVPDDFPLLPGGAVSGTQRKFSVSMDYDGRYREPTARLSLRERDHAMCLEAVAWSVALLHEKLALPKYQTAAPEALLRKLSVNLQRDVCLPPSYRAWVLKHVADALGWS